MKKDDFKTPVTLGLSGLSVSRIGLASGYGISDGAVQRAFDEFGINYFYWDRRKPGMASAIAKLCKKNREQLVVAIQSYDHSGFLLKRSVEKALKRLQIEFADILFLGWFNKTPGRRILETTAKLKESGKIRFLGVTSHNRPFHGEMAQRPGDPFDVLQVRYNAAHRGAEDDVFSKLKDKRPGIVTYTATRWGKLLQAKQMPPGEEPLTAADCYRFVLANPNVNVCLAGPKNEEQMLEGLRALEQGPLDVEALERIRRIGDHVHG